MSTVWSYRAIGIRPYWRTIFFYAGSDDYNGLWMGCSDCVWIVPGTTD